MSAQEIAVDRSTAPATPSSLPLIAVALAGLSILLGATVIWGILAFPIGIAATVIALIIRARCRRVNEPMPQLALIALVLGPIGAVLSVLVVVLLLVFGPFLRDTVSTSTSPIQKSIQSDINQINADETRRINQANQFQKQFQSDLNQVNSDLASRVDQISAVGTQTTKDVAALRSDLTNMDLSLHADISSLQNTTDSLTKQLADLQASVTDLTNKVNFLCAHQSCP